MDHILVALISSLLSPSLSVWREHALFPISVCVSALQPHCVFHSMLLSIPCLSIPKYLAPHSRVEHLCQNVFSRPQSFLKYSPPTSHSNVFSNHYLSPSPSPCLHPYPSSSPPHPFLCPQPKTPSPRPEKQLERSERVRVGLGFVVDARTDSGVERAPGSAEDKSKISDPDVCYSKYVH